jgi:hypothetical protein
LVIKHLGGLTSNGYGFLLPFNLQPCNLEKIRAALWLDSRISKQQKGPKSPRNAITGFKEMATDVNSVNDRIEGS